MNITIVNPRSDDTGKPQIFMSILYMATALERKGHKVVVIDAHVEDPLERLERFIDWVDLVGFSVMTTQTSAPSFFKLETISQLL